MVGAVIEGDGAEVNTTAFVRSRGANKRLFEVVYDEGAYYVGLNVEIRE